MLPFIFPCEWTRIRYKTKPRYWHTHSCSHKSYSAIGQGWNKGQYPTSKLDILQMARTIRNQYLRANSHINCILWQTIIYLPRWHRRKNVIINKSITQYRFPTLGWANPFILHWWSVYCDVIIIQKERCQCRYFGNTAMFLLTRIDNYFIIPQVCMLSFLEIKVLCLELTCWSTWYTTAHSSVIYILTVMLGNVETLLFKK